MRKYLQGAVIEGIEQMENDRNSSKSVSPIKTKLETISRLPWLSKLWVNTVIFYWLIKAVIKSSKLLNTSAFHKIATALCFLDRVISLRQVRNLSILLRSRTRNSLKSCKHRKRQLKIFKASFKVWDAIRQMNWKGYWLVKNFPLSETFFNQETKPCLTETSFSPVPFANQMGEPFASLSDLLDTYYKDKAERDRVKQQASELIRRVENELQKIVISLKSKKKSYWRQTTLKNFVKKENCWQPSSTKCLTTKTRLS